jgi:hypothetical protein
VPGETNIVLFLTASLVVIVAPGPDNILALTRGVTLGRRVALVSAVGASVGLVTHSLFAAAGLSVLLARSSAGFWVVKCVGGGVPDLPRPQGAARPGGLRPSPGLVPRGGPKRLRPGRSLERLEPQDSGVLFGVPAAVCGVGRHGPAASWLIRPIRRGNGFFGDARKITKIWPPGRFSPPAARLPD